MRRLPPRDLRALLSCLRDIHAPRDLAAFPHHVVAALRHSVDADCACYDGASPTKGRTAWVIEPFDTFPGAQRWPSRRSRALPDVLALWLARQQALLARDDEVPPPPEALVIEREENQLRVRLLADTGQSILLLDERVRDIEPVGLARLGLTKREAEVLAWVPRGKTNDDTARILGTRPATVAKHLERIFRKLGVETRTAAAARAFEVAEAGVVPAVGAYC